MTFPNIIDVVRKRAGYLIGIAAVIAVLAFSTPLILDADEADLRYDRNSIPAHRLDSPNPGDAYAFNHGTGDFSPIKLCTLHKAEEYPMTRVRFAGVNDWGLGLNDAISQVGQFVGEKILAEMQMEKASVVWEFNKTFRADELSTKLEAACRDKVVEHVRRPDQSVFIVDMVYFAPDDPNLPQMVQLSRSSIIPKGCDTDCMNSVPQHQVLKIGWLTRKKADWDLVRIE